ncbi:hypothetical protein ACFZCP_34000 [Streptomyces sp. NPDC007971]|uniref:hypothetical protein n=1 Tax=Streptomyces sp. NPDC007971 TaxID=3364799 RepID=UPI0036E7447F
MGTAAAIAFGLTGFAVVAVKVGAAALAWAAVPSPAKTRSAVAAAEPTRRHLPCLWEELKDDLRNVQPPDSG